jgi:beta-glucosidase
VTFYRSVNDLPSFDDYSMNNRTYRYFHGDPLWGFGYGLGYAKFAYSALRTQRTAQGAEVSVRVKNDSARDGDEVVQLYLAGAAEMLRQLRGFQRVHLRAGESREVRFTVDARDAAKGVKFSVGGGQPVAGIPHLETTL